MKINPGFPLNIGGANALGDQLKATGQVFFLKSRKITVDVQKPKKNSYHHLKVKKLYLMLI